MKILSDQFATQKIFKTFRRRLTNLSSRNRSLLLSTLPSGQFLDLHETDFLLNKPSFTVIADLISRKPAVSLCEVLDPRQERSNEVSRKLRQINRAARFIEEERGTEDLYVGWPFVKGKFLDDTVVHGPLLFFPVQIEQQGKFWKLTRRGDELAFLNPTLALAYGQFNQVKLPDEIIEMTMDDFDRDPLAFRTQLYEWLKSSPFDINFNKDLFIDTLHFFTKQTTSDLVQLERTGELKLYPEAILGIFPQAGSFLVPDYDALLEEVNKGEIENKLDDVSTEEDYTVESPTVLLPSAPPFLPEKFIHTPLPMDASQEAALRAVKAGESLVVQGPPGTGKSQLIANLMADAAASGKRVLLVCQKRAALDVVADRLRHIGMGSFLALIHDFQDDRRALYAQIAEQIAQIDIYRQQNNGLNTVLLERDFEVESRQIDATIADLQAFKNALFNTDVCGVSAKELYLTSDSVEESISLAANYQQFPLTGIDSFTRRLADYAAYQQRLGTNHPWQERVSFASFTNVDLHKTDQVIAHWEQLRQTTDERLIQRLGQPMTAHQLADWQAHSGPLMALMTLLKASDVEVIWLIVRYLYRETNHPASAVSEEKLAQIAQAWDESLAAPGPEVSLETGAVRQFKELLTDARNARTSWLTWQWWLLTNPGKAQLQQVVLANRLTLTEADLQVLATRVEKRLRLEATRYEANTLLNGLNLPEQPASLRLVSRARQLIAQLKTLPPVQQLPENQWQTANQFTEAIGLVVQVAESVEQAKGLSQTYLTIKQLNQIWTDQSKTLADLLRQALRQDFDLLVESDRLQAGFSDDEQTVVEQLRIGKPTNWVQNFQNGLRRAWLNHLEAIYPILRSVSSLQMTQWEQVLQKSVLQKQALSRDILLVKLREQTYRNLTLNRLNNITTYRDLLHQTSKKRNVWPVRKLMETFANEVFKLVPCWLASPESVSAMFPLKEGLFDLVIFDEASQCFAESGIPAIVRGKQVVITGDNQQLRPSDLYRIRLDETETEEIPAALEVESLLELASQQLPQVSLTEHYRSQSLDLITFSNEHFYQNKLSLLPNFTQVNQHEPAIRYLNVKGTWQQNTNPVEAEAVLQLLDQLRIELPGRSVGIVTFNYPQQQLIQDMLENNVELWSAVPSKADQNSTLQLFVKNIENVQGDERDVIIFSVGYAPDQRGRLSMQFGSLNARGGENRLNVAVTRARERVYVVTSLWPEQLTIAETANSGPKRLKSYLSYALRVAQNQFKPLPAYQPAIPSSTLLKDKLAIAHPDWQPELPFADLTVKEGNTYKSLILTDDTGYYQQSTKQAHAYLPLALQRRQWPFRRIWSRNFWRKTD